MVKVRPYDVLSVLKQENWSLSESQDVRKKLKHNRNGGQDNTRLLVTMVSSQGCRFIIRWKFIMAYS